MAQRLLCVLTYLQAVVLRSDLLDASINPCPKYLDRAPSSQTLNLETLGTARPCSYLRWMR